MAEPDYFTIEQFRELPLMDDDTRYSNQQILDVAAEITSIVEREVGTSFVPRQHTVTVDGNGAGQLVLSPFARTIVSVTYAGGSTVPVDGLRLDGGVLTFAGAGAWTTGTGNITVIYEAGAHNDDGTPPADVLAAVKRATRWRLLANSADSDVSARQTSMTNDQGGTVSFTTAGPNRPTGYPDVDAVIIGWRDQLDVFGFA